MKRFLLTLIACLITVIVYAQESERTLVLDQASFKPIQKDALTGVAIDQIGQDSSRRPCARIKMKVERMTREEIDGITLKIATNNELIKCKTADYDNGLIIELTAKPQTRFYLHHDKFGDSEEVTLNLEPNKEYYMEARLNILYSITVQSNVVGAEIFIDDKLVEHTSEKGGLIIATIENVTPGEHTLHCQLGETRSVGQKIFVSAKNIFFREDINIETEKFNVVFNIEPKEVTVLIDGLMEQTIDNGRFSGKLPKGDHTYRISSPYHIPIEDKIKVEGDVDKNIFLKPLYGAIHVTSVPSGASVVIDGQKVGTTPLDAANIEAGRRNIEMSKAGYETYTATMIVEPDKVTNYEAKLVEKKKEKAPKPVVVDTSTRFESNIELGYSMHTTGSLINHIGAAYIGGIRAGKSIFAGLGVGAEYNMHSIDNQAALADKGLLAPGAISVPIFAHLRAYMGSSANHFVALSVGGKLFGKNTITHKENSYSYHTNGIFGDVGYGIKFGKLYVSAGVTMQSLPKVDSYTDKQLDIKSKIGVGAKLSVGLTF